MLYYNTHYQERFRITSPVIKMKLSKQEITEKIEQARALTISRSQRWSMARTRALEALLNQSRPCTAYDLLNAMQGKPDKALKPASLYRILDSFCALGIAFRIDSTRSFFANRDLLNGSPDILMICDDCGGISGIRDSAFTKKLIQTCKETGFVVEQDIWTMHGHCKSCQDKAA